MLLKDEVEMLREVPYFSRIEPCKLKLLAFTSARVCYHPGEIIFDCGDASDCAYVIMQGRVELSAPAASGEHRVGIAGSKSIIGEMCLLGDQQRRGQARAVTEVEALRITKDSFQTVVADNPRIGIEVTRALAQTLRDRAAKAHTPPGGVREPLH